MFNCENLRDMGGLETPLGTIKTGMLYRGPALNTKDKQINEGFMTFPVDVVVDLRTKLEQKETPDVIPNGAEHLSCSVFDEKTSSFLAPTKKKKVLMFLSSKRRLHAWKNDIIKSYEEMPFSVQYQNVFNAMDQGKRIYFHCAAGKDRTGICAMLIELSFGRDFDSCLKEYLATNDYYAEFLKDIHKKLNSVFFKPAFREFLLSAVYAKQEYFETAKKAILDKYGDVPTFLKEVHGIDEKRIAKWAEYYIDKKD